MKGEMMDKLTLGVIVGNRGFFPSHLCETGRETVLNVLAEEGIEAIKLSQEDTTYGSIESLSDARKCAELFKRHRDEIDGVLVTLPNFGDERAIANALRWADLDVPVLIQAFPDDLQDMSIENRRDSFCGKMSASFWHAGSKTSCFQHSALQREAARKCWYLCRNARSF
jgi:L-fucose isomerase-like protein